MGGSASEPSLTKRVVRGRTGHAETVRVLYRPRPEGHQLMSAWRGGSSRSGPTRVNRQGPERRDPLSLRRVCHRTRSRTDDLAA